MAIEAPVDWYEKFSPKGQEELQKLGIVPDQTIILPPSPKYGFKYLIANLAMPRNSEESIQFAEALDTLGAQGWEECDSYPYGDGTVPGRTFIFKKEVEIIDGNS